MIDPYVSYELVDGIAIIEFFHPQHNSLPLHLLQELTNALKKASNSEAAKVVLLKSGGDRTFCAGASLEELISISDESTGKQFFSGFGAVINAIRENHKLVVARIQGKAVGGGVGLIAAADSSFATKTASVRLSELNIGIGPFVIAPAVKRKIGLSAFSRLSLHPTEWMGAEEAAKNGLFTRIFDTAALMDTFLESYLKQLVNYNPEALKNMKNVLWEGTEHWPELLDERASMSGKLVLSSHTKQALAKFK